MSESERHPSTDPHFRAVCEQVVEQMETDGIPGVAVGVRGGARVGEKRIAGAAPEFAVNRQNGPNRIIASGKRGACFRKREVHTLFVMRAEHGTTPRLSTCAEAEGCCMLLA